MPICSQTIVALPHPEGRTKSFQALPFSTKSWGQTLVGLQKTSGAIGFVLSNCFVFFGLYFKAPRSFFCVLKAKKHQLGNHPTVRTTVSSLWKD